MSGERIPVLYLAPWIVFGGSDKNTVDWFRWIDRERFAPYLVTTQPAANELIHEVEPYAEEIWALPDLIRAEAMPAFILDLIESRRIEVVHLMNSRLGFDLMPDMAALSNPPAIVLQLHVEEVDRSGYVRYTCTRYGNLVDRFSISNQAVATAVRGYGVPAEKVEVIYTGVDPSEEFRPGRLEPAAELDRGKLQVLWAGRLVEQKDPLLMVDVAAALRRRGVEFEFQVLGGGELEGAIRERIAELDLGDHVFLHPPVKGLQRWYEATDALLMTSSFEGIPVVIFEAMAMGLPIVAPPLPAIQELLGPDEGLVADRADAEGYADELARLAESAERERAGAAMRAKVEDRFSVQEMAAAHERIYAEFAAERPEPRRSGPEPAPLLPQVRFPDRRPPAAGEEPPLVSVVTPHFNQARFLRECVESVLAQTHPAVEIVVVDDASTEAGVPAALDEIEALGVTVVRLEENGGPSRARNLGLERCNGAYVLPVDSDNVLLPDAIETLLAQLLRAGEDIGFVYPNIHYFGNREGYLEMPDYNLFTLLYGNFCDTCSLLDRRVFDAGIRYSEDIKLGHEDWEFVLQLAGHGIRGEVAEAPTVRYRKWGFNRSDLVDYAGSDFRDDFLAQVSPFRGRELEVKATESPSLSLLPLAAVEPGSEAGREVAAALAAQSCADAELIARFEGEWPGAAGALPPARPSPAGRGESAGEALRAAVGDSRGAYLAVARGDGRAALADPAFVEKVLRAFADARHELDAIVFADGGEAGDYGFRPLDPRREIGPPHLVVWRRRFELELPLGALADAADPVGSLAELLAGAGAQAEWRHLDDPEPGPARAADGEPIALPADPQNEIDPHGHRPGAKPWLPGRGRPEPPRWKLTPTWVPPMSTILTRYRDRYSEHRFVTNGEPPPGYEPEHHLGALRATGFEGTLRLLAVDGGFRAVPREEWAADPEGAIELGYSEEARLPEMDAIVLARHRGSGEITVVAIPGDPLLPLVDLIEGLGCADPFPLRPRETPPTARPLGLLGLVKAVDDQGGRLRYALGELPPGETLGEIGALSASSRGGGVPAWIVDGQLLTRAHRPPRRRPRPLGAARWVAEPIRWGGMEPPQSRSRSIARRAGAALAHSARPGSGGEPAGEPDGWLFGAYRSGLAPLYAAYHGVNGDQLLTKDLGTAARLGYAEPTLLGFVRELAPLTGTLDEAPLPIPWAYRFGAVERSG